MSPHADRDHSEEPVDLTGFEAAYANAPHAGAGGQGDPVDEQRHQRYAEAFRDPGAFVERRRVQGVYPNSDRDARETLTEWQARAVMAVADAEQADLRAEVERLRMSPWDVTHRECDALVARRWREDREALKAAEARAEAAERALADERAKVAKVRHLHRPQPSAWTDDYPDLQDLCYECGEYTPCETLRALAGPELETTEVIHMCPPGDEALTPCCGKSPFELPLFSSRMTVDPSLVTCRRPEATEGGA